MKKIINKIKAFTANNNGSESVEWVVIVGILVVSAIVVYGTGADGPLLTILTNAGSM
jgi:Flp pilus assembly pilin Flp